MATKTQRRQSAIDLMKAADQLLHDGKILRSYATEALSAATGSSAAEDTLVAALDAAAADAAIHEAAVEATSATLRSALVAHDARLAGIAKRVTQQENVSYPNANF